MNKFVIIAIILLASVMALSGVSEYISMAVGWGILVLAVLAWFNNISKRKTEKSEVNSAEINEDDFDEEFHNDFSKVPAGEPDPIQPPPRSIGYGYGDGGKSVIEDLERIGIDTKIDKKSKNKMDIS